MVSSAPQIKKRIAVALLVSCLVISTGFAGASPDGEEENYDPVASLEDLLRSQSELIMSFDYLLHMTPMNTSAKVMFLESFEDLLRRQAILNSGFEDILKEEWEWLCPEEQEEFLESFADLLKRELILLASFEGHLDEGWSVFTPEEQSRLLGSYEDLLRRQADLHLSYEELLKMKNGGLTIVKLVDREVVDRGQTVTYSYVVKNWCRKTVCNVVIIDDKLGTVASGITLGPRETKTITKSVTITESVCNSARAMGEDPESNIISDESNTVCVIVPLRKEAIEEPRQYEQYCESQKVEGTGTIAVQTSIVDNRVALEYSNMLAGDGDIELDAEHVLSENASKLLRTVSNNTVPLNFFEETKMTYSGSTPLVGKKQLESKYFYGGIGAKMTEMFAVDKMEKDSTAFFASTDPSGHWTDPQEVARVNELVNSSPVHLLGMDTKDVFDGTWGTQSEWHKILEKNIQDSQSFTGSFETAKLIKFHESPFPDLRTPPCLGVDC